MATKAEIQQHIALKLRRLHEEKRLTGPFVESVVIEKVDAAGWQSIANWIQTNNHQAVGQYLASLVKRDIVSDANREAAQILSDDAIDLSEYARIEGLP